MGPLTSRYQKPCKIGRFVRIGIVFNDNDFWDAINCFVIYKLANLCDKVQ